MEYIWKKINEITHNIYKCYLNMQQLELDGKQNSNDYENLIYCLKSMFEIEDKLYQRLSIPDIELIINGMKEKNLDIKNNTDTAINYLLQQEWGFIIQDIRFFELRKYNKIMEQYRFRKDYSEEYFTDFNEDREVDCFTKTFNLNNRVIFVMDRVGAFESIKNLACTQIDLNYMELFKKYWQEEYVKIKYNLLFVNPTLFEYCYDDKKIEFSDKVSNDLFDYFINLFSKDYADDNVDDLLDYKDEELNKAESYLPFFIGLLSLRTVCQTLDDKSKRLLEKKINESLNEGNNKVINNILFNLNVIEEKKEKIKK